MTERQLSPDAQAVLNAFLAKWPDEALEQDRWCLAYALRAAADQVMPGRPHPHRTQLLAIADELEETLP
jgi:hypothetical protein